MGMMEHDILKVLYTEEEIKARVHDLGARMYEDLKDKDPLFVSVLRGAFIFMADIVRACQVKCDVEFIAVSWTSPAAGPRPLPPTTWALWFPMSSWWATGWITARSTGTCPTSEC